jgi:hypothetical protein
MAVYLYPIFLNSTYNGHRCQIPYYLDTSIDPVTLDDERQVYLVKTGWEVGIHIDE